jgi:hypothetical protein
VVVAPASLNYADSGYRYTRNGGNEHPERPSFHASLDVKIILAALVFAGGVYYLLYALRHGRRLSIEAIDFYALMGGAGILVGVAFTGLILTGGIEAVDQTATRITETRIAINKAVTVLPRLLLNIVVKTPP